jgi:hypothetical protein
MPDYNALNLDRLANAAERIMESLERIETQLDNLAALHAAGPALKATGANPQLDTDGWIKWNGDILAPVSPDTIVMLLADEGRQYWGHAKAFDWSTVHFYKIANQ